MKRVGFCLLILISLCFFEVFDQKVQAKKITVEMENYISVCSQRISSGRCHAHLVTDSSNLPKTSIYPKGLYPTELLAAYNLLGKSGSRKTIAIIDAFDAPTIFSDLNNYSKTFGLQSLKQCPISIGTLKSPCFQKVNQRGGTNFPVADPGWALETSMDVEIAHAICQNCNILLVEADNDSFGNLISNFDKAISLGAKVVSNSYGSSEFPEEVIIDKHFNHPGVAITFSSGDNGYGVEYPAASKYVTSVGGTTLKLDKNGKYLKEVAWSGAGSGCSKYVDKPTWQKDKICQNRMVADLSAVADPKTGAAVYDSTSYQGRKGWFKTGGTSLAAPIIAGIYALSPNWDKSTMVASLPYLNYLKTNWHDISSGDNGTCRGKYLCKGSKGYDGPTGLGSPKGIKAL